MSAKVLVIAEHDNHNLKPGTLNVISAANALAPEIHVAILGNNANSVAEQAAMLASVIQVFLIQSPLLEHELAEVCVDALKTIAKNYSHILIPASTFGKNILPRLAAILNVGQISDVIQIISEDTFARPIYAGNAIATVESLDPIKMLSIRITAFPPVAFKQNAAPIEKISYTTNEILSEFVTLEQNISVRPELTNAKIVVSGGRGLQNQENFKMIETLADQLGAAVGASRAAVDAGFVPNDYQVGQTGKVVAPDLYIAVGISGAIQHISGMKDSKVIVAINKDPEAPIFQVADYGLVGDLFQILPELSKALELRKPLV